MGLASFFKKLWSGTKRVVDNPITQNAINVASVFMPQLQLVRFLTAYKAARRAEETLKGPGRGPEKFLQAFKELTDSGMAPREAKRYLELAVMVLDGTIEVRNSDTGGRVLNFEPLTTSQG